MLNNSVIIPVSAAQPGVGKPRKKADWSNLGKLRGPRGARTAVDYNYLNNFNSDYN